MFKAPESPYLVPFDGSFRVAKASTTPLTDSHDHKGKHRKAAARELNQLQRVLAAGDKHAVLLVFQARDAAGKDGTIRAVMTGMNPSGCQVYSFKQPSTEELDHDFLWRNQVRVPERGRIGIFNRSHYEDVLLVRVHGLAPKKAIEARYDQINAFDKHLAENGTLIMKFCLRICKKEQKERLRVPPQSD